jgi:outer membrane protein OmpA-like peptidoglycan-associated protein
MMQKAKTFSEKDLSRRNYQNNQATKMKAIGYHAFPINRIAKNTPQPAQRVELAVKIGKTHGNTSFQKIMRLSDTREDIDERTKSVSKPVVIQLTPEPRADINGLNIILWNFPINRAVVQPGHISALRRFFHSRGLFFFHRGNKLEIIGRASLSGGEIRNQNLSNHRAEAVLTYLLNLFNSRIHPSQYQARGIGTSQPLADQDTPEGMAINRSVEIRLIEYQSPQIPNRDEKWRYAQSYLEERVGAIVCEGPDVMWTPTTEGIERMIPRVPLLPDPAHFGVSVPPRVLCSTRPASGCMPGPHWRTRKILADELSNRFRTNFYSMSDVNIREVVDNFIDTGRNAIQTRERRKKSIDAGGAASLVGPEWYRYLRAERAYFEGDTCCLWSYIG